MLAIGGVDSGLYKTTLTVHLLAVVVGFGSTFVYAFVAARARDAGLRAQGLVAQLTDASAKVLTAPFTWLAILTGFALVGFSDEQIALSDTWIVIAMAVSVPAALVATLVLGPASRAAAALGARMASGDDGAGTEYAAVARRIGMVSGILHLAFVVLLVDMVWKPGT